MMFFPGNLLDSFSWNSPIGHSSISGGRNIIGESKKKILDLVFWAEKWWCCSYKPSERTLITICRTAVRLAFPGVLCSEFLWGLSESFMKQQIHDIPWSTRCTKEKQWQFFQCQSHDPQLPPFFSHVFVVESSCLHHLSGGPLFHRTVD